jgi:hypothetical protein
MFNNINDDKIRFTIKLPLILRTLLKVETEARGITMGELLTHIVANVDITCASYQAPTFDSVGADCYLSAKVSRDSWLKFKNVSKNRRVYLKILLRNMLRKRYTESVI